MLTEDGKCCGKRCLLHYGKNKKKLLARCMVCNRSYVHATRKQIPNGFWREAYGGRFLPRAAGEELILSMEVRRWRPIYVPKPKQQEVA